MEIKQKLLWLSVLALGCCLPTLSAQASPVFQTGCRQAWQGRQTWEALRILNTDRDDGIWFVLQPPASFEVNSFDRVGQNTLGQGDQRGSRLLHYDGTHWWTYPLAWKGIPSGTYLQYSAAPFERATHQQQKATFPGLVFTAIFKDLQTQKVVAEVPLHAQHNCVAKASGPAFAAAGETVRVPQLSQSRLSSIASGLSEPVWHQTEKQWSSVKWAPYKGFAWAVDFDRVTDHGDESVGFIYLFDAKGWHLMYRTLPLVNEVHLLDTIIADSEGAPWLSFFDGYLVRYKGREVCRWKSPNPALRYGRPFAGPKGQMWWQTNLPATSLWPLKQRYQKLSYYLKPGRWAQEPPPDGLELQDLVRYFFRGVPDEYRLQAKDELLLENYTVMTPLYFDGESFRYAAQPPREPLAGYNLIQAFNQSKRCWLIEDLNQGKVPPEAL